MTVIHKFDPLTCGDHDTHEWWSRFYARAVPNYASHTVVTDRQAQREGVDHELRLTGGGSLIVDCKCRCGSPVWREDVLLEVWSNKQARTPGWLLKPLRCHYIAYGWPQFEVGFLLPFTLLRVAYERNKHDWKAQGLQVVTARNSTYDTVSVAVPISVLVAAVSDAMCVYMREDYSPF